MREGRGTLFELSNIISKSSVILLIAASDVTLLEITIPPIPDSKLKLALPNLVEDHLMSDSTDCVLILAPKHNNANGNAADTNKRVVAVAERAWLQQLFSSFHDLGASHVRAFPAQLCLPNKIGEISARIDAVDQEFSSHLSMRFDADNGIGVLLDPGQTVQERLSTLFMFVPNNPHDPHGPNAPISLELPKEQMSDYRHAVDANPDWAGRIVLHESNWTHTIEIAKTVGINLLSGINAAQTSSIQWQIWRWPLALTALVLLANIVGLNAEYWGLKREANALKLGMAQTYQVSFPKDRVVPFPLEQMKKNLANAQRNAGQAAPYDFTVLLTGFGTAWSQVGASSLPKVTSIEYKDEGLMVQVKGSLPQEEVKKALSQVNLNLKKVNAETWQVKG